MTELEYLDQIRRLHERQWPQGLGKEPHYPFGRVPLSEMLSLWASEQPEKSAIEFYGKNYSYRWLDEMSTRMAWLLDREGVGQGDRVAIFMPNCPQYHVAFFGILKLGAVVVPVNPMFRENELRYELNDTGSRVIVASDALLAVLQKAKAETPLDRIIVTSIGELAPDRPEISLPAIMANPKHVPDQAIDMLPALEMMTGGPDISGRATLDATAAINYTGGSTGLPKGCIHTQADMIYTAATTVPFALQLKRDSRYLCVLPVFWMAGEVFGVVFPIFAGATVSLLTRWDVETAMHVIHHRQITHTTILVDGLVDIMRHPKINEYDLSSLEHVQSVSFTKKLTPEFRRQWHQITGTTLREVGWGMTETHTCDTMNFGFHAGDFDLSSEPIFVGLPVPGTDFKICDFETGALMPIGEKGELCIRSPSMLKAYWNSSEETANAIRNGWLHTGDNAYFDKGGFLHYLGRQKEMLKVNGMSVFPGEIEAILGQYPHILCSGVVGRDDPEKGEVPVAFVILNEDQRTPQGEAAFTEWCRSAISVYKRPDLHFVDDLPMTDTGKVRKDLLKKRLVGLIG
ncbi:MAG: AMP-binding protein [Rhodobacterales bacterium]